MMYEVAANAAKVSNKLQPIANIFNKDASKILANKMFKGMSDETARLNAGTITSGVLTIVSLILLSLAGLFLIIGILRTLAVRYSTKGDVEVNKKRAIRILVHCIITFLILGILGAIFPTTIAFLRV